MISKELISIILKQDINQIHLECDTIYYGEDFIPSLKDGFKIDIHNLAHKCKEWAMSQGFIILTYGEAYYNVDVHRHANKSKFGHLVFEGTSETEPEAIFKACEWILLHLED